MRETELYGPVKAFLEQQGYAVKAEINDCDVVAVRGGEAPVIVELKLSMSLALLLQGVDRLAISDAVYVAVPAGKGKRWRGQVRDVGKLCRRLGLGFMSVRLGDKPVVEVHLDPVPYQPRKLKRRRDALLREFQQRIGDPNTGGQVRQQMMTAYRQDALRIAIYLEAKGTGKPAELARALGLGNAGSILQKNHYGWFERVSRGVYGVSGQGRLALEGYGDALGPLREG